MIYNIETIPSCILTHADTRVKFTMKRKLYTLAAFTHFDTGLFT